jgi:hypothetical protein
MALEQQTIPPGIFIARLLQRRPRLLRHWITGGTGLSKLKKNAFDSMMRALNSRYYDAACTSAEREQIKHICMGSTSGVAWAKRYLAKGFPEPHTPLLPMFRVLEAWFASGQISSAHQVGCCSGRETAYFARRFPAISFTGSDCDPGVISFLREHWAPVRNLQFVELHMEENTHPADPELSCDVIFASGGFHYMDPDALLSFLIRARRFSSRIALSQPMDRDFNATTMARSTPRGMLSWNHPYPNLLRAAGWTNIAWEEGYVPELPKWKNFAAWADTLP